MKVIIGKVLRDEVHRRRMTFKEISKATGVPASTLSEWSANSIPRNPSQVKKVANYLNISMHFLLFGEEEAESKTAASNTSRDVGEVPDYISGLFEITIKRIKG